MNSNKIKFTARHATALVAGVILSTFATATSGCLAVAAGAGAGATVAYMRGDLDTTLNGSFDKAVRAANRTIDQLRLVKVSENKDALQATIIARNAADKKIELHIARMADDATKLKIRVGTFGDDMLQTEILAKIRSNL